MAFGAGADLIYKEFEGGHNFDSLMDELPYMRDFLKSHPRDPYPNRIRWETASGDFGLCRWFALDEVTTAPPAPFHHDDNVAMVDERITFGFIPGDDEGAGGMPVESVLEETPAEEMGLMAGDLIVKGGKMDIRGYDDLNEYKSTLSRGIEFSLTVIRDGDELTLEGEIPEPLNYYIFKREVPSGMAMMTLFNNVIDVRTSRVGAFRMFISPEMVNLSEPVVIKVNGVEMFNEVVEPDLEFMLKHYLESRDRRTLYVAEIEIEVPEGLSSMGGHHH
jgi:hypothetical protein